MSLILSFVLPREGVEEGTAQPKGQHIHALKINGGSKLNGNRFLTQMCPVSNPKLTLSPSFADVSNSVLSQMQRKCCLLTKRNIFMTLRFKTLYSTTLRTSKGSTDQKMGAQHARVADAIEQTFCSCQSFRWPLKCCTMKNILP